MTQAFIYSSPPLWTPNLSVSDQPLHDSQTIWSALGRCWTWILVVFAVFCSYTTAHAFVDKTEALVIMTAATVNRSDCNGIMQATDGPKKDSWIWSSCDLYGANSMWQVYLEDEKTGEVTIRPRDNAALCMQYEWVFNAQYIRTYAWASVLKSCDPSAKWQKHFLQKTSTPGMYVIRNANYTTGCLNIWGGNRIDRPMIQYECQDRGASNDRWWFGDHKKIAAWSDLATMYFYSDEKTRKHVPYYQPKDKSSSDVPGVAAAIRAVIGDNGYSTVENASSLNKEDMYTWQLAKMNSFTWGISETMTITTLLGVKDVKSISFAFAFSSNQSWTEQTTTTSSYTAKLPTPAYSTAWFASGQLGKVYTSKFDVTTDLSDSFVIGPITATVITSSTSTWANCSNQGVTNPDGYLTGAYPVGHACLVSWPSGLTAPTSWASGVKHCDIIPADHVYRSGAPCLSGSTPTPPASPPATPSDGLSTGVNYRFALSGTNNGRCLDYYQWLGNAGMWDCKSSGNDNQTWVLDAPDQDGYRMIRSVAYASACLVNGGDSIVMSTSCGASNGNTRWKYNSSTQTLTNKSGGSNLCLTAPSSNVALSGLQTCNGSTNQRWVASVRS